MGQAKGWALGEEGETKAAVSLALGAYGWEWGSGSDQIRPLALQSLGSQGKKAAL